MTRVDMHVHSTYSRHPTDWFLRKIGARESYTAVEDVYRLAKQRGMTYVTVTDHNTIDGALRLVEQHPDDCFVGAEITTYFPEDGCKIHVLVYGITPAQFAEIERVRDDIYVLRDYLKAERIACSVAHATYSINGLLSIEALEKLMLLFDVFESVNGTRNEIYNRVWTHAVENLTPNDIDRLHDRYPIEPWSDDPWIKGFTGGSDDHAGLLVAETHTVGEDGGMDGWLWRVRSRRTQAAGRHGDHKTLAFAIYKIAYEFSKAKTPESGTSSLAILSAMIFDEGRVGLREWLAVQKLKIKRDEHGRIVGRFFDELAAQRSDDTLSTEQRLHRVYEGLATLADAYARLIAESVERGMSDGNAMALLKNVSAALPAVFLAAPFFSALRHLNQNNDVLAEIKRRFLASRSRREKRLLWFSDTVNDLNGVAVTMRALARCAFETGRPMSLVTTLPPGEDMSGLSPNVINLPCIYTCTPKFYNAFSVRIPSLLKSIDIVARRHPDAIVVSTPGPVGVLGLIVARVLNIPCTGVYHTDFKKQVEMFIGDARVADVVEACVRFFYNLLDEVRVPTRHYMTLLDERGIAMSRMKLFQRGVEAGFAVHDPARQAALRQRHAVPDGPVLLWAGRLGKEKNLDMLFEVFDRVARERPGTSLLLVGSGPEQERLAREHAGRPGVIFAGRVPREELPHYYGLADVFVFPSTTDTFGMVVLEAQACGLPAVVTNVGGPQEIVHDGETGYVLAPGDTAAWVRQLTDLLDRRVNAPEAYAALREAIRQRCAGDFSWSRVLDAFMLPEAEPATDPAVAALTDPAPAAPPRSTAAAPESVPA